MKRVLLELVALVVFAQAAFADVTVTTSISILAAAMTADGTITTYGKGTKVLADTSVAGQNTSVLSDAATRQQWTINHGTKTIEPLDLAKAVAALPIAFGDAKVSVTPNGQRKDILGRSCESYMIDISIPATVGGETITMRMVGPAWVAKEGPGVAEYRASNKTFTDVGMSTAVLAQGPQGKGMAAASKALADAGMVLEQELKMTMEGTGQMAQMMGQAAGATITIKVTAITTDPIPDAKFALPEGYTKK
jgi:hypothetical protein